MEPSEESGGLPMEVDTWEKASVACPSVHEDSPMKLWQLLVSVMYGFAW